MVKSFYTSSLNNSLQFRNAERYIEMADPVLQFAIGVPQGVGIRSFFYDFFLN